MLVDTWFAQAYLELSSCRTSSYSVSSCDSSLSIAALANWKQSLVVLAFEMCLKTLQVKGVQAEKHLMAKNKLMVIK